MGLWLDKLARVAVLGALCLGVGCARPPPHRSDALARSQKVLRQIEDLEAELHAQSTELDVYGELHARSKSATEVTCQVSNTHLKEIQRLAEAQRKKRRERRHSRKVALLGAHPEAPLADKAAPPGKQALLAGGRGGASSNP